MHAKHWVQFWRTTQVSYISKRTTQVSYITTKKIILWTTSRQSTRKNQDIHEIPKCTTNLQKYPTERPWKGQPCESLGQGECLVYLEVPTCAHPPVPLNTSKKLQIPKLPTCIWSGLEGLHPAKAWGRGGRLVYPWIASGGFYYTCIASGGFYAIVYTCIALGGYYATVLQVGYHVIVYPCNLALGGGRTQHRRRFYQFSLLTRQIEIAHILIHWDFTLGGI